MQLFAVKVACILEDTAFVISPLSMLDINCNSSNDVLIRIMEMCPQLEILRSIGDGKSSDDTGLQAVAKHCQQLHTPPLQKCGLITTVLQYCVRAVRTCDTFIK